MGKQKDVRQAKIKWVYENIDVTTLNPYDLSDVDYVIDEMRSAKIITKPDNATMLSTSTSSLIREVRRMKGLK